MWLGLAILACNPDPGKAEEGVGYRTPADPGPESGERGTVQITEVMWSGSVTDDGVWDPSDVFFEVRNVSSRPVDLSGWRVVETGTLVQTWQLPDGARLDVGQHAFVAAKTTGCFPEPDYVLPGLRFPTGGDPFSLTLEDFDERLIEPIGSDDMPAFAGGYDLHRSRSMERTELMFGGEGTFPHIWHYYTDAPVDTPNNTNVADGCRRRTLASPGSPSSPDYSGAFSSGSFE
jgi:hypothetical protein